METELPSYNSLVTSQKASTTAMSDRVGMKKVPAPCGGIIIRYPQKISDLNSSACQN